MIINKPPTYATLSANIQRKRFCIRAHVVIRYIIGCIQQYHVGMYLFKWSSLYVLLKVIIVPCLNIHSLGYKC